MMDFFKVAENFIPIELSPLRVPGFGLETLKRFVCILEILEKVTYLKFEQNSTRETRHPTPKTVLSFLNHLVDSIQQAVLVAILCQLPKHNALEPVIQCIFRFCPDGFNIVISN